MHADARKLLWDAQQAAERIARFTAGKGFTDYEVDEALNQLARVAPRLASQIADLPRIVAFRNVLIHGYATVDNRLVWGVIETSLDPLRDTLASMLGRP